MGRVRFGTDQNRRLVARSARTSGLANGAAGDCSSYGSADSYGARGARQRSGGVEKYSSIASRQAPEHGSRAPAREAGARLPRRAGTPFSGCSKAKSALDTASGVSRWWLHDLRRTLATGLQRLGVRLEVAGAVLNHLSGSQAA